MTPILAYTLEDNVIAVKRIIKVIVGLKKKRRQLHSLQNYMMINL